MAMARRSAIPSVQLVRSKYQDFEPKSEWKQEDEAHFFILHLPGFLKEQVRITYLHSSQTIRVHGERPMGNYKWTRFDKSFALPPNCLSDKIYGRLQHGFLTVTIPKQTLPTKPEPKPTSTFPENERQTSEKISSKLPAAISDDEDQKHQKEASSPLEDNLREHKPEVGRAEERSDKAEPEISEKIAEKTRIPEKQLESREKVDSDAEQNPEKEVKKKESLSDADEAHQLKTEKEENESPEKQTTTAKTTEGIPGKTPEITEKERKRKEKEERNPEENGMGTKQKGDQVLKIRSKRLEEGGENRQMLINMGAALLVLVAIGAYTAFNFPSFPKSRN